MTQLNLFKYFKASSSSPQVALPSPDGPLLREVPSTAISSANKEVEEVMASSDAHITEKKRKLSKQKATIGNYTLINGTSAALRHYVGEFPDLKYTTICEWKKVISSQQKKESKSVTELNSKKRGRPPMFPEEVTTCVMKYIFAVRDAGGVVNTAIVFAAASGIVRRMKPELLESNGGYVVLPVKKDWAKYLLSKMDFVKRKATTKKPKMTVANFDELKDNFLMDIMTLRLVILTRKAELDQIAEGLAENNFLEFLRKNSSNTKNLFVYKKKWNLTAAVFGDLFTINFSTPVSKQAEKGD